MHIERAEAIARDMRLRFGDQAGNVAADYADRCGRAGDLDGFGQWSLVCAMIYHVGTISQTLQPTRALSGRRQETERQGTAALGGR